MKPTSQGQTENNIGMEWNFFSFSPPLVFLRFSPSPKHPFFVSFHHAPYGLVLLVCDRQNRLEDDDDVWKKSEINNLFPLIAEERSGYKVINNYQIQLVLWIGLILSNWKIPNSFCSEDGETRLTREELNPLPPAIETICAKFANRNNSILFLLPCFFPHRFFSLLAFICSFATLE